MSFEILEPKFVKSFRFRWVAKSGGNEYVCLDNVHVYHLTNDVYLVAVGGVNIEGYIEEFVKANNINIEVIEKVLKKVCREGILQYECKEILEVMEEEKKESKD